MYYLCVEFVDFRTVSSPPFHFSVYGQQRSFFHSLPTSCAPPACCKPLPCDECSTALVTRLFLW